MDFEQAREFFRKLDKDLQYPNCEGRADEARITAAYKKDYESKVQNPTGNSIVMYECIACGHLYHEMVSQCDCMPDANEYRVWHATPTGLVVEQE